MPQLCSMLGIEIPIVQAPMGGAVPAHLAAAVSNASALGTLSRILAACENDTVYYESLFDGGWRNALHRVPRNSTVRNWEADRPPRGQRPREGEIVAKSPERGAIDRYASFTAGPDTEDEIEPLSLWSGQSVLWCGKYSRPPRLSARSAKRPKAFFDASASKAHRCRETVSAA